MVSQAKRTIYRYCGGVEMMMIMDVVLAMYGNSMVMMVMTIIIIII